MNKGNFFATLKLYSVSRCLAEHSALSLSPFLISSRPPTQIGRARKSKSVWKCMTRSPDSLVHMHFFIPFKLLSTCVYFPSYACFLCLPRQLQKYQFTYLPNLNFRSKSHLISLLFVNLFLRRFEC